MNLNVCKNVLISVWCVWVKNRDTFQPLNDQNMKGDDVNVVVSDGDNDDIVWICHVREIEDVVWM